MHTYVHTYAPNNANNKVKREGITCTFGRTGYRTALLQGQYYGVFEIYVELHNDNGIFLACLHRTIKTTRFLEYHPIT